MSAFFWNEIACSCVICHNKICFEINGFCLTMASIWGSLYPYEKHKFYSFRIKKGYFDMTKSELIQRLADMNPHLYLRDVEKIVETVFNEISDALARGDRVELRGFGAFSVKHRDARVGRNPRTGETVHVEEKRLPFFKTGKALREKLNGE